MPTQQVLEFLINDWKTRRNDFIDVSAFVSAFTDGQSTRDALTALKLQGYINVTYADDTIYTVSLNQKFKDKY